MTVVLALGLRGRVPGAAKGGGGSQALNGPAVTIVLCRSLATIALIKPLTHIPGVLPL